MILRLVVFGSGAVLMALEIVGSRVLAPYFGSSVYVWGSLISIFLAALSVGYYLGGLAADRWPRPGVLAATLGTAGVLVLLLPVVARPILEAFSAWDLGPRLSPLLASVVLFALPSVLMGATSPFAIKLAATTLARVGNTAGVLYAISTAGSILGTLLTAFVLIPTMGVRAILYALGVSLVAFAALMLLLATRAARLAAAAALLALVLGRPPVAAQTQCGELRTLFVKDTEYHHIRVEEDGCIRWLFFNRSRQGGARLGNMLDTPLVYPDYVLLAWLVNPQISRVLMVGLGAGSIPRRLLHEFPQVRVDSVELDPTVRDVAKQFFQVVENDRHRIIIEDGRRFLLKASERYDLIVMDAYNHEGVPFHLTTREFIQLAKRHLTPGGMIMAHVIGYFEGPRSRLFRAIYKTYATEFPALYVFGEGWRSRKDASSARSIMLLATARPGLQQKDFLLTLEHLRRQRRIGPALLTRYVYDLYEEPVPVGDVPVLTDDYAPVDILPVHDWEPARK
ncbi:MAG TPA: fused MFS/spermidine synthase [bacterium]|nr:fused MFS/spermidine synthase [bacterium]